MAEVVKFEIVDLPRLYLVGKEVRYHVETPMKDPNRIPSFWQQCFADGTFSTLETQSHLLYDHAYVGLLIDYDLCWGGFSYLCGMLFKEGVTVPEGFSIREIGGEKLGWCRIKGKVPEIYANPHTLTEKAIQDAGHTPNGWVWKMELHGQHPDENGDVVLDFVIPLVPSYESIGNRIVSAYIATYPIFKPMMNCGASEDSQREMYDFLYESMHIINDGLSLIDDEHQHDDCYQFFELNYDRPGLIEKMQESRKKFFDFYEFFFKLGVHGEPVDDKLLISKKAMRISKKHRDRLPRFGLHCEESRDGYVLTHEKYKKLFPAWKLHSSIPADNRTKHNRMTAFLHGSFNGKQYSAAELFSRVSRAQDIEELENYFIAKGYHCEYNELQVTYEKEYPKKQKALMRVQYDWRRQNPLLFVFKSPRFSEVIKTYDQMDDALKELVFYRTKTCDGCGYCVQTDKTGKSPILSLMLEYDSVKLMKCPLFPALHWNKPTPAMQHLVKKLFDYSEACGS